jgi:fatty-acyl-CoA synthase
MSRRQAIVGAAQGLVQKARIRAPQLVVLGRAAARARMVHGIEPWRTPAAARVVAQSGLGVRSVHALQAALHPHRPALYDDSVSYTYAELDATLDRVAYRLVLDPAGPRLQARDVVMLCLENSALYCVLWFAALRAGLRVVHASYESTPDELRYLVQNSRARLVAVSSVSHASWAAVRTEPGMPRTTWVVGMPALPGETQLDAVASRGPRPVFRLEAPASDAANIVYTSGTTGRPKGAVRDLAALNVLELGGILDGLPLADGERHWVAARLYHSAPQAMVLLIASLGGSIGIQRRFDPADLVRALSQHAIDSVFLVPTMIARVLDQPEALFRAHPPRLRLLLSGAAPFPQSLRVRAIQRFGVGAIHDFYGATELGWVTTIAGPDMLLRPHSIGRPLRGLAVRIERPDGSVAPPREVGVLRVSSAQAMLEYLHNPQATAETTRDGWMTVDDTAWQDEDGFLYLAGRARDMIISGGVNVYPAEVENVLCACPGVQDVTVVGIPDELWGERVEAWVVLDPGVTIEAVDAWARVRLGGARRPRAWHVVVELPRNPTGKVLKRVLRDDRMAQLARGEHPASAAKSATPPKEPAAEAPPAATPKAKARRTPSARPSR